MIANVLPTTAGDLPPVIKAIQGGPITDTGAARVNNDCYLTSVKISGAENGVLKVSHAWQGLSADVATATAATKIANTVFPWHKLTIEVLSAAYKCIGFEAEAKNELSIQSSLDEKTAGAELDGEWADGGIFSVSLTARFRVPVALTNDFHSDVCDSLDFVLVALNTDATAKTFTLDLSGGGGLDLQGDVVEVVKGKDAVIYEVKADALPNDLAVWSVAWDDGEA
jgi:hypothetical protein